MVNTGLTYNGKVNIQLKLNDKIINSAVCNSGTKELHKAIAIALSGNIPGTHYTPQYIDLIKSDNTSALYSPIALTKRLFEESEGDWVARFTGVIPFSKLINKLENDNCTLQLKSDSTATEENLVLAKVDVNSTITSQITAGTQLIVEWVMSITG